MNDTDRSRLRLRRQRVLRVYLSGFLVLAVLYAIWRLLDEILPVFSFIGSSFAAVLIGILTIALLPLALGFVVEFLVRPLFGGTRIWSQLFSVPDRFVRGLEGDEPPKIVLVNWPSSELRAPALMTSRFPDDGAHAGYVTVFIPSGPMMRNGHVCVVPLSEVEVTDWPYQDLTLFLLSYGSICPDRMDVAE